MGGLVMTEENYEYRAVLSQDFSMYPEMNLTMNYTILSGTAAVVRTGPPGEFK